MNRVGVYASVILLLLSSALRGQTGCGTQHTEPGAFICYPNPAANPEDASVPDVFHLSAQGNAPEGRTISRYTVQIDGRSLYENRLAAPVQQLSIETNLKSPFSSGSHTLRLVMDGAGTAKISGLGFHVATNVGFCDPFSRFDAHTCSISNSRGLLQWSVGERPGGASPGRAADPFDGYVDRLKLFGENLKSVEADIGDAVATDPQGNLYVASHSLTDVELRKYAPDGSLVYANLVRSCGDGFVAIAAMAIDKMGRAWIVGNTTACLPTTSNAFAAQMGERAGPRGFVMMIDAAKPSSAPLYVTYLSPVENSIRALRVDNDGNAYVAGTTASAQFPHESTFRVGESNAGGQGSRIGFVSVLNASGSALRWSALLQGAQLNALALDGMGNVYVTGRAVSRRAGAASGEVLVAALSDNGHRLSYVARFGGSGAAEGRAISTSVAGNWVLVAGAAESAGFAAGFTAKTAQRNAPQPFAVALQPCATGSMYARLIAARDADASPEIAIPPALDAFSSAFPEKPARAWAAVERKKPFASVQAAPKCTEPTP